MHHAPTINHAWVTSIATTVYSNDFYINYVLEIYNKGGQDLIPPHPPKK